MNVENLIDGIIVNILTLNKELIMGVYIEDPKAMKMLTEYRDHLESTTGFRPSAIKAATMLLKQTLTRRLPQIRRKR